MNNLLKKLVPQGSRGIIIWLIFLVGLFLLYYVLLYCFFEDWSYATVVPSRVFFFQAEDGIRDRFT
jgi:hypothetical protein